MVQWGIRAIPVAVAAMLVAFVLNSAGTEADPEDTGSVGSGVSVFGTIHPDIFRFRTPIGAAIARGRLQLASLDPRIASDAAGIGFGIAPDTSALPCGSAWLDESLDGLDERVAFYDKPISSADECPVAFADRFASAMPGPQRASPMGTAAFALQSAPDRDLGERRLADAPKIPVTIARVRPGPPRKDIASLEDDGRTAIYDITARTVYLPNGKRLEAHSGLGSMMDNPRHTHVRMRGSTPPNIYTLTMRERLFHGVRALRLNPVDEGRMHGRAGILAHTYMLGSNGQSNGCVSFSNYPEFLNAYQRGEITRLAVVEHLDSPPGRLAAGQLPAPVKQLLKDTDQKRQYAAATVR